MKVHIRINTVSIINKMCCKRKQPMCSTINVFLKKFPHASRVLTQQRNHSNRTQIFDRPHAIHLQLQLSSCQQILIIIFSLLVSKLVYRLSKISGSLLQLSFSQEHEYITELITKILTSFSVSLIGLPTKLTILSLWFFPCLCFRASC